MGLACIVLFGWCAATAPWRALRENSRQHGWLGLIVALALLWSMRARLHEGMDLHLAGASLAALMFGPRLACTALGIVLGTANFTGAFTVSEAALQGLAFVLLPAFATAGAQRALELWLPRHVFIYVFGAALAGSFAANALGALAYAWLASSGTGLHARLPPDFIAYRLLLAWGEAMLTCMLAAVFLAYRPQWLMSFRDERYLKA